MSRTTHLLTLLAATCGLAFAVPVNGQKTDSVEYDSFMDFSRGDVTTSTLTWDGFIEPPIARELLAPLDVEVVWDVLEHGGARYIATGHRGKLFAQEGDAEPRLVHEFDEPSIYTLATHGENVLAAASPGGVVYTVTGSGEVSEFARTGVSTIWSMVPFNGGLALGTGPRGHLLTLDDSGTTATLVQFPDTLNVLSLAAIPGTTDLAVATQGPGLVARVSADGTWRVLIDPQQEEVRRVIAMEDGVIYAAVNGIRSPGERLLQPAGDSARMAGNSKPRPESFIVRIGTDGFVEEWWTAPESPIHDIAIGPGGSILVASGERGLLFEVTSAGDTNLRGVADQKFITRMASGGDGSVLVGTGAEAALLRVTPGRVSAGVFESDVLDGRGTVRWSRIRSLIDTAGGSIRVSTRSGNTATPNDAWSDWTTPAELAGSSVLGAADHVIESPMARFLQFRFELESADGVSRPRVDAIRIFSSRPNAAPVVREVSVQGPGGQQAAGQAGARPAGGPGGAGQAAAQGGGRPAGQGGGSEVTISWSAMDPDNDELRFDLFLRPVGGGAWLPVAEELDAPRHVISLRELPDGEYRARVVVTDAPSNPVGLARTSSRESGLFTVDTTPPVITLREKQERGDGKVYVSVRVEDAVSLIQGVRWRVGFGDWRIAFADDGALDSRSEVFTFPIDGAELNQPGMFVMVSATDMAGNIGTARIDLD